MPLISNFFVIIFANPIDTRFRIYSIYPLFPLLFIQLSSLLLSFKRTRRRGGGERKGLKLNVDEVVCGFLLLYECEGFHERIMYYR